MSVSLHLAVEAYHCRQCLRDEGRTVTSLVRMIPRGVVMDGKIVGDEYWGCPVCLRPKFDLKRRNLKK